MLIGTGNAATSKEDTIKEGLGRTQVSPKGRLLFPRRNPAKKISYAEFASAKTVKSAKGQIQRHTGDRIWECKNTVQSPLLGQVAKEIVGSTVTYCTCSFFKDSAIVLSN